MTDFLARNSGTLSWIVGGLTIFPTVLAFRRLREEARSAKGWRRRVFTLEMLLVWFVPLLAFVATKANDWSSEMAEKNIGAVSNKLVKAESDLSAAKNRVDTIDPLNRPISDISALVSFTVKEENPSENTNWGTLSRVAVMMLCESNLASGNTNISGFFGMSRLNMLEAEKFDRYFDGKILQYVMKFHLDSMGVILREEHYKGNNTNKQTVAWALENVRFIEINPKFLPHDAEVLGGSVVLTINSGPQKWFSVRPQRDLDPNSGRIGYGYQIIASNSTAGL